MMFSSGNPAGASSHRLSALKSHVKALNEAFADWIQIQRDANAFGAWSSACEEYVKYLGDLQREYSDVLPNGVGAGDLDAAGAPGTRRTEVCLFGTGDCGQLGFGEDVLEQSIPKQLSVSGLPVVDVVCGGMHTIAITGDGRVWTWGVNDEGALGRHAKSSNQYTIGMKPDSAASQANDVSETVPGLVAIPNASKAVMGVAGDSHSFVLLESGVVFGWGAFRNSSGVFGFDPNTKIQKTPAKVAFPGFGTRITEIASGSDHAMALDSQGGVFSWGCAEKGRLGRLGEDAADKSPKEDPGVAGYSLTPAKVTLPTIKKIACGFFCSFALTDGGVLYGWGINNYGQLGVKDEGPFYAPQKLDALSNAGIDAISSGEHHTLALTKAGKVLSFGRPTYGRLGRADVDAGKDAFVHEAEPVAGITGRAASVATGIAVSGAVTTDGKAYVWGYGTTGQLGKASDEEDENLPYLLATKRLKRMSVIKLSFGGQHSALIATHANVGAGEDAQGGKLKKRART